MSLLVEPNRLPAEPIVKVIREYLDTEGERLGADSFSPLPIYALADRADLNGDTLQKTMNGHIHTIDFDVADRLLCVMNLTDLWRTDLSDLYQGVVLDEGERRTQPRSVSGEKVCARRGCSVRFVPHPKVPYKKYCSRTCQSASWAHKTRGVKGHLRGKGNCLVPLVCQNGHERTPENTTRDKKKGVLICRDCKRASSRRYREPRLRGKATKLTIEQVREIRASGETHGALGRRYGVSRSTVTNIKSGKTWANEH